MIRDYYAAGKLDELCSELLNDSLDEDARRSLGVRQEQRSFASTSSAATRLHSPIQRKRNDAAQPDLGEGVQRGREKVCQLKILVVGKLVLAGVDEFGAVQNPRVLPATCGRRRQKVIRGLVCSC